MSRKMDIMYGLEPLTDATRVVVPHVHVPIWDHKTDPDDLDTVLPDGLIQWGGVAEVVLRAREEQSQSREG